MKPSVIFLIVFSFFISYKGQTQIKEFKKLPYLSHGLSERKAAEHLLSRFTFGVNNDDIDAAIKLGLENWLMSQLKGEIPDPELDEKLEALPAINMTNQEIVAKYSLGAQLRKKAIEEGLIGKEEIGEEDKEKLKKAYLELAAKYGLKPVKELENQTINHKILRAVYSKNQMHEVLTDFWFNHFNVFMGKNQTSRFVLSYERDAIRPHVTGTFADMLKATAKSPAMLTYLDNFLSMAEDGQGFKMQNTNNRPKGLNENYAREIMELHTLGVDGGYTQDDVRNAARIFTGWTIYPMGDENNNKLVKLLENIGEEKLAARGFVREGDFLFAPNRHEKGSKEVMGVTYDHGGYEEGLRFLDNLSKHPSTARFICTKLARRFINDDPDGEVIKAMSETFIRTRGNIEEVLLVMVYHYSFWKSSAIHQKIKSPFEYAISAVRALKVEINNPAPLSNWITKMGQKLYFYQAPTGFPDKGKFWINTGSLLNRMNFGLDLANGKIKGLSYDPEKLMQNQEPESPQDAVVKFGKSLFPERNIQSTIARLTPLVDDPEFSKKINNANQSDTYHHEDEDFVRQEDMNLLSVNSKITHVLGMLIGSPEFQRK
jgi:uncharacterized protein (DUF1800 family)